MGIRQAQVADVLLRFVRENWIVIGGLFAVVWPVYQFASNRSIPFNVSINLESVIDPMVKGDTSASSDAEQALPITIKVNVENKSEWRELAIRDPAWVAYGFRLEAPVNHMGERVNRIKPAEMLARINNGFASDVNPKSAIKKAGDRRLLNYSYTKELIGAGLLLGDREIRPRETLNVQHILPVERGVYDFVQIRVYVPTLNQQGAAVENIRAPLMVLGQNDGYEPQVSFCIVQNHGCMPLKRKDLKPLGAQTHSSVSEIWVGQSAGK